MCISWLFIQCVKYLIFISLPIILMKLTVKQNETFETDLK